MSYPIYLRLSEQTARLAADFCGECKGKCCSGCASRDGYLNDGYSKSTKAQIDKYKALFGWDAKLGFNSPEGCHIPRDMRSITCQGYYCSAAIKDRSLRFDDKLDKYDEGPVPEAVKYAAERQLRNPELYTGWRRHVTKRLKALISRYQTPAERQAEALALSERLT